MSVTFHIEGCRPDYGAASTPLNLNNHNAGDLLE
jgi:hypothetical protein